MAEYIDRKAAIKQLRDVYEYDFPTASGVFDEFATKIVPRVLKSIPAADVVPVVRCKDCENAYINSSAIASGIFYCSTNMRAMLEDDFCSYGERRDGGADNETD